MTAIIIDDEFIQSDYLQTKLNQYCPSVEILASFQNPVVALKYLQKNSIDLIFLDIEMPEMTGFEFIEIVGVKKIPNIIFTTAHSNYAVNAFRVNAIDYLLKPIDKDELINAVEKIDLKDFEGREKRITSIIKSRLDDNETRLVLTEGKSHTFVSLKEIIRIEGSGSYSDFFMTDGSKITTSKRLNFYWKKLENLTFIRPHQSHIVNIDHILKYDKTDGDGLLLSNKEYVPISTRLKQEIKAKLGIS